MISFSALVKVTMELTLLIILSPSTATITALETDKNMDNKATTDEFCFKMHKVSIEKLLEIMDTIADDEEFLPKPVLDSQVNWYFQNNNTEAINALKPAPQKMFKNKQLTLGRQCKMQSKTI